MMMSWASELVSHEDRLNSSLHSSRHCRSPESVKNVPSQLLEVVEYFSPPSRTTMAASFQSSIPAVIRHPFVWTFTWLYMIFQSILNRIFSPVPPPPTKDSAKDLPRRRVAVIGAGLTGVSSAAHCVGHGLDVQIFESRPKDKGLGGIWSVSARGYFGYPRFRADLDL